MKVTLKDNPNYFFDDYQRAGDHFHIPSTKKKMARNHHVTAIGEIVTIWRPRGIRFTVLTRKSRLWAEHVMRHMGVTHFVQSISSHQKDPKDQNDQMDPKNQNDRKAAKKARKARKAARKAEKARKAKRKTRHRR